MENDSVLHTLNMDLDYPPRLLQHVALPLLLTSHWYILRHIIDATSYQWHWIPIWRLLCIRWVAYSLLQKCS